MCIYRVLFGVIGICALAALASHFAVKYCKKSNSIVPSGSVGPLSNPEPSNPRILSDFNFLIVAVTFVFTAFIPIIVTGGKPPEKPDDVLFLWLPLRVDIGIVIPSLFFYFNKNLTKYAKRGFWDNAPDCLQKYNPTFNAIDIELMETQSQRVPTPTTVTESIK